jgi:hypothetical protein
MLTQLDLKAKTYALESILEDRNEEISKLKDYINKLESKLPFHEIRDSGKRIYEERIKKLEDKLYSALDIKDFREWQESGPKALSYYLDALAASYAQHCNINPLKSKLVVSVPQDGKSIQYFFELRDGKEEYVEIHKPI